MFIEYGFIGLVWGLWCYTASFGLIVFLMVKLFDLIYNISIKIRKFYYFKLLLKHCYIIYFEASYKNNENELFSRSITGHQILYRDKKIKDSIDIHSIKDSLSEWFTKDGIKPNVVLKGFDFLSTRFYWEDEFEELLYQHKDK